ncbi:MAG: hypothetical protein R3B13_29475 [Polyangiaceae bacterium]
MRTIAFGLLAPSFVALGCNNSSAPAPGPTNTPPSPQVQVPTVSEPAPTTTPTVASTDPSSTSTPANEPTPDPITHPCVVHAAKYAAALDQGKTDCQTDADCGCYQGGIGRRSGCGGVLNLESLKTLAPSSKAFHDDGCRHTQNCAPWACMPKCRAGTCVKK